MLENIRKMLGNAGKCWKITEKGRENEGICRKMSENDGKQLENGGNMLENVGKLLENVRKMLENVGKMLGNAGN